MIGGKFGGRRLVAPNNTRTRPTSDRVRQALFDVLTPNLNGAVTLDLYAGSGALGIEALSRGAARAIFVEADAQAIAAIRSNVVALGVEALTTVMALSVERSAKRLSTYGPFDLVLCDPPWAIADDVAARVLGGLLRSAPASLVGPTLLAPGARLVIEHSARKPIEEIGGLPLQAIDRRIWGDTGVTIFAAGAYSVFEVARP
ncbi:MAG: 16S rRNA (guanine(966)-N(2))-methyltransferase RsmD [Polyangiaceae bacterium]|nr:16S rRNA (guanine(966)-N(2))-methyltransferase RsmD [Polyangiaceae bacterium]